MGSRADRQAWEAEYDRRLADPDVRKDTMKSWRVGGSETRVADAEGVMRRRNGEACCGCGKGDYGPHWQDHHFDLNKPAISSDSRDDPPGKGLIFGIF